MITSSNFCINPLFSSTRSNNALRHFQSNDFLEKILNKKIEENICTYIQHLGKITKETLKYLYYYHKKFSGNIAIPIKNLCNRLGIKERAVHYILANIYRKGLLVTTKGGYGKKVTCRALTPRGLIVLKNLVFSSKEVINRKTADYYADYPGTHTNYISSKVDILKENTVSQAQENSILKPLEWISKMKSMLADKINE